MGALNDGPESPHPNPAAAAIAAAQQALERLRGSQGEQGGGPPPRTFVIAGRVVALLAVAGLVVHTFFEDGLQVTETSVLLLAVALLAPFAARLKVIEFGGAKAEWRDDATVGLSNVIQVLEAQHASIEALVLSIGELQAQQMEPDEAGPSAGPGSRTATVRAAVLPGPLPPWGPVRRALWVCNNPMNNAYEAQGLRRLLEVDEATSTTEALGVLRTGRYGLVISDIVREEAGVPNVHAGRDLLRAVRGLGITVPVIFYGGAGGAGSMPLQDAELRAEGAADVVVTHVELLAAVRRTTREVFEAAVRHRAGALLVEPAPTTDVDAVLAVPGEGLVALELANWLRQPKRTAVEQRGLRLTRLIQDGTVRSGWVVAPGPEIPDHLRDAAPTGVEVLTFDELDRRLPSA